jgi:hypothetical protein
MWRAVASLDIPAALMGGIAMSVWKHIRATRDVDILVGVGSADEGRLLRCLAENGFIAFTSPPIRPIGDFRLLQVMFEPPEAFVSIRADLLIVQTEYHRKALERRVTARLPYIDLPLSVLTSASHYSNRIVPIWICSTSGNGPRHWVNSRQPKKTGGKRFRESQSQQNSADETLGTDYSPVIADGGEIVVAS